MDKIPILFTAFNRLEYTKQCLTALSENTSNIGEIYIIDNASTDGTVEYLKSVSFSNVSTIIYNDENVGVAGAMNQFFKMIDSEYFAKVDNDTIVPFAWLDNLYEVIKSEEGVDFIQAKHYFVMQGIANWDDLLSKYESKKVLGSNLIYSSSVGGSGIIGRTRNLKELSENGGKLIGWTSFQKDSEDTVSAFYDGVEVKVLDIEYYNRLSLDDIEYHIETGRIGSNGMPPVSIIIPIIREERVKQCLEAIGKNIIIPKDRYEIVTAIDRERIGCPKMVKKLVDSTKYDLVMFLGDDTIPQRGFLIRAMMEMEKFPDGWGLVGLNDGIHDDSARCATHWLAHKKLLDYCENREFFFTGYKHTCCDRELTDIAIEQGRYVWAEKAKLIHNHPIVDKKYDDDDYRASYSRESSRRDQKLYLARKRAKGYYKLGIAFPLTSEKEYTSFWTS